MPWSECAMLSSRLFECFEALTLRSIECSERCTALAMRRMHRNGCIFLMHLTNGRYRRECNREPKGENEGEKCQTWSHRKTSCWNQNQRDRLSRIIVDWFRLVRE